MLKIPQGTYVEITKEILAASERAPQIPEDTKETPLMMKVKGFLQQEGKLGEKVSIKTILGRDMEGILTSDNPRYPHDFGNVVPELFEVRSSLKNFMNIGDQNGQ